MLSPVRTNLRSVAGDLIAGRYEVEALVGSGGMASVYRAHDRLLERRVALKILHDQFARNEDAVARFRREARAVAQLTHPNIVTVIDRGEDDGRPFIVFEYVDGVNLKQVLERDGALPVATVLDLAVQVARALEAAHQRGVVHRDVKPQNVLIGDEGPPKVTDFGIARARGVDGLTLTGTVMGTGDYMPPEQARGEPAGEAGDVYSLGAMLYELLTGEVPYEGENPVAVAMRHVRDPVPSVAARRPDVPPRLDALVRRALAKEPEQRFGSMSEVIAELEACRPGTPLREDSEITLTIASPVPAAPPAPRRGRRTLRGVALSLAVLVIVAAAAVGAYVLARGLGSGGTDGGEAAGVATAVRLLGVGAYDPDGDAGEHDDQAPDAVDGDPASYWRTETYQSSLAELDKSGVGVVLDARQRAGDISQVSVVTDTPGFAAEIRSGGSPGGPFRSVSGNQEVAGSTTFRLDGDPGRYLVVWITDLGENASAHVNEVRARR